MNPLDAALLTAWNTLAPRVRADRAEAIRRAFRRSAATLSRPIRPWSLCLRASDSRLLAHAWLPKVAHAPDIHDPHEVVVSSHTLRKLCAPVIIDWPGIPLRDAADRLGRSPSSLDGWVRRGILRCKHYPAPRRGPRGGRGKPVPYVWSPSPIDPNANDGAPPDPVWGTLWQYHTQHLPDDLEFSVIRITRFRPDPRGHIDSRGRPRGHLFVCPGLATNATSAPSEAPGGGFLPASSSRAATGEQPPRPPSSQDIFYDEPLDPDSTCGRLVSRLYLPLSIQTLADALDDDPLDLTLPFPARHAEDEPPHLLPNSPPSTANPRVSPSPSSTSTGAQSPIPSASPSLACHHCHRLRYLSLLERDGWNLFIAHISAGLLYGHEVPRRALTAAGDLAPAQRKHRYTPRPRPTPRRDQVLTLLLADNPRLTYKQIAARLRIQYSSVHGHVKAIYKQHGVRSRPELQAKMHASGECASRSQQLVG